MVYNRSLDKVITVAILFTDPPTISPFFSYIYTGNVKTTMIRCMYLAGYEK